MGSEMCIRDRVKGFPVGTIVNGILVMSDGKILVESKGKPLSF